MDTLMQPLIYFFNLQPHLEHHNSSLIYLPLTNSSKKDGVVRMKMLISQMKEMQLMNLMLQKQLIQLAEQQLQQNLLVKMEELKLSILILVHLLSQLRKHLETNSHQRSLSLIMRRDLVLMSHVLTQQLSLTFFIFQYINLSDNMSKEIQSGERNLWPLEDSRKLV